MKDKNIAALLAFFLGSVGAHKFYLGQIGWGIVYFLFSWTLIPGIVAFIEFIMLALMDTDEFNRRFNGAYTLAPGQPVVVNMLPPAGYSQGGYPYYGAPGQPMPGQVPPGQAPFGHQPHANPYAKPGAGGYGPPQQGGKPDLATQLDKLNELRIAGLLTEEEFQQQKAKLLDSM